LVIGLGDALGNRLYDADRRFVVKHLADRLPPFLGALQGCPICDRELTRLGCQQIEIRRRCRVEKLDCLQTASHKIGPERDYLLVPELKLSAIPPAIAILK